ncbi:hypothetical protein F4810DRAFT_473423 [Camillea tinctor]|nr:hypothetical protein F4810DRAFT_473423 [Camillea tinctor]
MVYCGKPSRGCQMCRTRRIKCDETKPTCNQCAKSRRQCPGYKDEFDLVFRNETKATERRAQKASRKAMAKMGGKQQPITLDARSPTKPVIVTSPGVPIETQANCYFISNFILIPRGRRTQGYLDFVLPLLEQDGAQAHLRHAFNACSMAFLNNRGGSGGRLTEKALYAYTLALTGTNNALRDLEEQKKDSTLAAVLLLGLFESITAKQIGSMNWGSHTWGAIQLVKARGRKQLKTRVGLQLFIAVRTQMIIHSLTTGTAPTMGSEWWITDAVSDPTAAASLRILIKTAELRAEVTRLMNGMTRSPDSIEVMLDMIRKAQAVDRDAVAWMSNVPAAWRFRTVAWEDHIPSSSSSSSTGKGGREDYSGYARAEVFPGRVDVYRDFWTASVWNLSRTARLILASLVVRCAAWVCAPVDYRTTPEYATAARTCADVIADIIASVPYHLGWHLKRKHLLRRRGSGGQREMGKGGEDGSSSGMGLDSDPGWDWDDDDDYDYESNEEKGIKGLAGYFLTWPMTCVNSNDFTTDAQRAWIHGRLRFIGNDLGVKYAHILWQLPIRIPSMMIRRDGLMAKPWGANHNFEKYVSAKLDPSDNNNTTTTTSTPTTSTAPNNSSIISSTSIASSTPNPTLTPTSASIISPVSSFPPPSAASATSFSALTTGKSASSSSSIVPPTKQEEEEEEEEEEEGGATTTNQLMQQQQILQLQMQRQIETEVLMKAAAVQKQQKQQAAAAYLSQQQQQGGYDTGTLLGNRAPDFSAQMATGMGVSMGGGWEWGYGYGHGFGIGVDGATADINSGVAAAGAGGRGSAMQQQPQPQWIAKGYPPI